MENEVNLKIKRLDEKIERVGELDSNKEATIYTISTLEKRMHALDEKLAKELMSMREFSMSRSRDIDIEERKVPLKLEISENSSKKQDLQDKSDTNPPLTVSQLQKEQLYKPSIPKFFAKSKPSPSKINDYRPNLTPKAIKIQHEEEKILSEECELEPTRDLPVPIKKRKHDRESLNERIARLERLNKKKESNTVEKAVQMSEKQSEISDSPDLADFLPGETESILISTMLDKVNKTRVPDNFRQSYRPFRGISPLSSSFKSMSQYSQKQSPSNSECLDSLPSQELQDHLRLRGFKIHENRPVLNRQPDFKS